MTMPMKSRNLKLQQLTLHRETLANLTAGEAEMAWGGKKKPKTKPLPRTLNHTCDPPSADDMACHPTVTCDLLPPLPKTM